MKFTLFRLICTESYEQSLLQDGKNSRDSLFEVLQQQPSGAVREGYTWHVGNMTEVSPDYLWFRFGRTSHLFLPQYDEDNKMFIDEESEQAPYTIVLVDMLYQVAAIAHKQQLLADVSSIANTLQTVLNIGLRSLQSSKKIDILELYDQEDIIKFIQSAYIISEISFEVGKKNNWDVDEHVQRPHETLLELTHGEKSTTAIEGENLNKDAAIRITRSVGAKGRPVSVKGMRTRGGKRITKHSQKLRKEIDLDKRDLSENTLLAFHSIRSEYKQLRHGE